MTGDRGGNRRHFLRGNFRGSLRVEWIWLQTHDHMRHQHSGTYQQAQKYEDGSHAHQHQLYALSQ